LKQALLSLFAVFVLAFATPAQAQDKSLATAWEKFADDIRELGPSLLAQKCVPADDPQVVSTAYRYLATLLYVGLDIHLLTADPDRPEWSVSFSPHAPYGGDHRDGLYHGTMIDPDGTYRVTGRPRGGLPVVANIQTMDGWWQPGRANKTIETLDVLTLEQDADGGFELIVGGPKRGGNWLPLAPNATHMMFRQYMADDKLQKSYDISIKRIDQPLTMADASDTPEALAQKLANASGFAKHLAEAFLKTTCASLAQVNTITQLPPEERAALGANEANSFWFGSWDMRPDQALLIELTPVPAQYWSIKGHNIWYQALPQASLQMQVNMMDAVTDRDGKVRVIVSERDPGYPNWIATGGLRQGVLVSRWNNKKGQEELAARLVEIADLPGLMPADSVTVSLEERRARMEIVRRQVLDRYGR
jgi:hypothetical protein